ncbi:hypothetical protein J4416_02075 [Candidatus Pacearchaeota archaeon]|nr:hypothetical protein [Candidatus Pacearchaeota archaeon]
MKKKRSYTTKIILTLVTALIILLSHTYVIFDNPFDSKSTARTISGKVVTDNTVEKEVEITLKERIFLGAEWVFVILIFLKLIMQEKSEFKEYEIVISKEKVEKELSNTDLDTLYKLVKEKKKVPVKALAVYFKVNETIIIGWAKILEEANLLTVHYPNFGHPILILNEEVVTNEEKENKT